MHLRSALMSLLLAAVLFPLMPACTAQLVDVPEVKTARPAEMDAKGRYAALKVEAVKLNLAKDEVIGSLSYNLLCIPEIQLFWGTGDQVFFSEADLADLARQEIRQAGLPLVGDPNALFESGAKSEPDLLLGAVVQAMRGNFCTLGITNAAKGDAWLKVSWQVYSAAQGKVVYTKSFDGLYKQNEATPDRGRGIWLGAFRSSLHNLLADEEFRKVLTLKTAATSTPVKPAIPARVPQSTSEQVPAGPISIPYSQVDDIKLPGDAARVEGALVEVISPLTPGWGFFISPAGYLLTNQHLLGDAAQVRLRLASGEEVPARVLRRDAKRDVALLKVERTGLMALPVAAGKARAGVQVFLAAAGLPHGAVSGVVGGYMELSDGLTYLVGDIALPSWGVGLPLLDTDGSVLAMAGRDPQPVEGKPARPVFIPMLQVFKALNMR